MSKARKGSQTEFEASDRDGGTILGDMVDVLQSELIRVCMELWRAFKHSNRNRRLVIDLGVKIFDMLVKYKASRSERDDMKTRTVALADIEKFGKELSPDEQFAVAKAIKRAKALQSRIRPL